MIGTATIISAVDSKVLTVLTEVYRGILVMHHIAWSAAPAVTADFCTSESLTYADHTWRVLPPRSQAVARKDLMPLLCLEMTFPPPQKVTTLSCQMKELRKEVSRLHHL